MYYIDIMFKDLLKDSAGVMGFHVPASATSDAVRIAEAYLRGRRDSDDAREFSIQSVSTKKSRGVSYEAL